MSAFGRRSRVVALAVGLLGVGTLAAAERIHTVAAGESAASLAKRFYGAANLADVLLRYNGRLDTVVHPGERLKIPFCNIYRARAGDTWSGLAKQHLGRASASSVLAELNGYPHRQPLRVGARVVFPVVLRHTLARGETLSSLADRFYGDAHKATVLQAFSRIDDAKRLAVGTPLEIPLVNLLRREADPSVIDAKAQVVVAAPPAAKPVENVVASAGPDASSVTDALPEEKPEVRVPPPPTEARRLVGPLAEAGRRFAEGEYDRARDLLEGLRDRVTSEGGASDRREWGELLAFVYVALDRDDDACTAYRSGSPSAGPADFDPDLISPRIRAVLSKCPAANPSLERLDNPGPAPQIPIHGGTRG